MTAVDRQTAIDPDEVFAAAIDDIFAGRAQAAVSSLRSLIAADDSNPIHSYWLAAALGAAGDWDAHRAALADARLFHALKVIDSCGGDIARMQRDPAYAEHLGGLFYEQHCVAVASVALGLAARAKDAAAAVQLRHGLSLQHQGRSEEAAAAFASAAQAFPGSPEVRSFLLYSLFYVNDGVRRHAEEARRWSRIYAAVPVPDSHPNPPLAGRPLRLGYVAPTVTGAQCRQFLTPVLEHHDPTQVEVFLYLQDDSKDARLPVKAIRNIGRLDDAAAARLVADDRIDVLVDLWGHTANGRLGVFARKPAPVQVSWLNYVQTTGLPAIDYLVHVDCMDVPGAQDHCTETIWRIGPYMAPFRPDPRPGPTPTPARRNGYVTFGSYNHPARLSDETVAGWSRILHAVPESQLVLRYQYFADEVLQNVTLMRFAAHGVQPGRIQFHGRISQPAYYESYGEIDMALDPAPCPGGTTSCDAVANGVPLLTLAGDDYFSRIGVAVVGPLGLDELITYDWDCYVERAVALTADVDALDALRARIRAAFEASGRRDEAGFTRNLEANFRAMFEAYEVSRAADAAA